MKKVKEKEVSDEIKVNERSKNEENDKQIANDNDPDLDNSENLLQNKRKRGKMKNFKVNSQFIMNKADTAMSKKLWGVEKPLSLEELTINILPDTHDQLRKKPKFVWDPKKKRFTYAKLDENRNIIRKNESGVKIKEADKFKAYKNWRKKTKLKIQNVGEVEKKEIVDGAKINYFNRKK